MNTLSIQPGIYEHYKGNRYRVLHIAEHTETHEMLVVYRALYGSFKVWIRPLSMFCEIVEHNGESVPRFKFVFDEISDEEV